MMTPLCIHFSIAGSYETQLFPLAVEIEEDKTHSYLFISMPKSTCTINQRIKSTRSNKFRVLQITFLLTAKHNL